MTRFDGVACRVDFKTLVEFVFGNLAILSLNAVTVHVSKAGELNGFAGPDDGGAPYAG